MDDECSALVDALKSKTALLFKRERELFEFRQMRDRIAVWLESFRDLTVDLQEIDPLAVFNKWASTVVRDLGFHSANVMEIDRERGLISALVSEPRHCLKATTIVDPKTVSYFLENTSGCFEHDEPKSILCFSQGIGIDRFYWFTFKNRDDSTYLLIARRSAAAGLSSTVEITDESHFFMLGNHVRAMLENVVLVSEVKRERQELRRANAALTKKGGELEAAVQETALANENLKREAADRERVERELRLAQKLEAVGQLAAGIAHEINTPIQFIGDNTAFVGEVLDELLKLVKAYEELFNSATQSNISDALLARIAQAVQDADLEFIQEQAPVAIASTVEGIRRVAEIVRAMKEFSHPGTADKREIDVNRSIETTVTVARNEWKYVAEVVLDLAPNLPSVPALAGELNQVLLNLLVNAAHAIGDKLGGNHQELGTIKISTSSDDRWVEITITDDGTGMPQEVMAKIFDPFFTTKEVGRGTGQGLAIAHSVIVDKHSGQITVKSTVGEGTTFTIKIPLQ